MSIFQKKDTLAQKICRTFPDAAINSPSVIIVGAQNVGKTKLIQSLVFHHLLTKDFFTDEIAEKIFIKLFHTGPTMATRRPTTIHFSSDTELEGSLIRLELGEQSAEYTQSGSNEEFDNLLNLIESQSKELTNHAYGTEVNLTFKAPSLPNISFTDLPGNCYPLHMF